jgi:hypothetical protein
MFGPQDIKISLEKLIKKTKDFLLSKASRESLVFLFFLGVAFSFWFVRALDDDYSIDIKVPVKLVNVPNNVIISQNLPPYITLKVRDKGSGLIKYEMEDSLPPILIDFNNYRLKGQHVVINTPSLDRSLFMFNASTKIVSIKPYNLEFFYTNGKCKEIPVCLTGNIRAEKQYYIADTLISPRIVRAYAPQKILDTLSIAYTLPVFIKGINNTVHYKAQLKQIKGVKFVPNDILFVFHADVYSEKKFEVPIVGINFPKDKRLLTFPSKATVTFQVGSSHYQQIQASDFSIEIPYEELRNYNFDKYNLRLTRMPREVRNPRISPNQVDFLIEQSQ